MTNKAKTEKECLYLMKGLLHSMHDSLEECVDIVNIAIAGDISMDLNDHVHLDGNLRDIRRYKQEYDDIESEIEDLRECKTE